MLHKKTKTVGEERLKGMQKKKLKRTEQERRSRGRRRRKKKRVGREGVLVTAKGSLGGKTPRGKWIRHPDSWRSQEGKVGGGEDPRKKG